MEMRQAWTKSYALGVSKAFGRETIVDDELACNGALVHKEQTWE